MVLGKAIDLELCEPQEEGVSVSTVIEGGELVMFYLNQGVKGMPNSTPEFPFETVRLELDYIRASELRDDLDKAIRDMEKIFPKEVLVNSTKEIYHALFT